MMIIIVIPILRHWQADICVGRFIQKNQQRRHLFHQTHHYSFNFSSFNNDIFYIYLRHDCQFMFRKRRKSFIQPALSDIRNTLRIYKYITCILAYQFAPFHSNIYIIIINLLLLYIYIYVYQILWLRIRINDFYWGSISGVRIAVNQLANSLMEPLAFKFSIKFSFNAFWLVCGILFLRVIYILVLVYFASVVPHFASHLTLYIEK